MAALPGLRPLADLDLHEVGRVDHLAGDPEAPGGHLLAAPERVLAVHVLDLAALAVHRDDVGPLRRLGVGAVGDLPLGAEAHRGDHDRVGVQTDAGVHAVGRDRLAVGPDVEDVAQRDRLLVLELAHLRRVLVEPGLARRRRDGRLVHLGVEAEGLGGLRLRLAGQHPHALLGVGIELGEPRPAVRRAHVGGRVEDLRELGLEPDRGEQARVATDLVDPDGGDHLLDPLAQGGRQVVDVGAVVVQQRDLHHHVRADGVGAEPEGEHRVVHVSQRRRAQHDSTRPAQVHLSRRGPVLAQGQVHGRESQVGVEIAAIPLVGDAVGEDQQLATPGHGGHRLLLEPVDRGARVLGLQARQVEHPSTPGERLPQVLQQVGAVRVRDRPVGLVAQRGQAVVPTEDHGNRQLHHAGGAARCPDLRPDAENGAAREVLHLALAVDRRVGDHRHRLLEEVGEILPLGRQARERAVVAEGAHRLGSGGRHLLHELHVLALPAEAAQYPVLHLHGLRRAGARVAGDLGALERATQRRRRGLRERRRPGALQPARATELLELRVVRAPGLPLRPVDLHEHLLAGGEGLGLTDQVGHRDHARLGREDVLLARLDLPQGTQAQRVDREHVLTREARDERHRALREGPEHPAHVHVEGAQLGRHPLDLVDDRRQRELERLGEGEAVPVDEGLDHAREVLRVRALGLQRGPEHPRLLAQAGDRVDLPVVAKDPEGLNAPERGPGVGGVAVVPEHRHGLGPGIAQVGVVAPQDGGRPEHLVDGHRRGARGHVNVEALLEGQGQLEASAGIVDQARHLPEDGLLLAGRGAEGGRVDRPPAARPARRGPARPSAPAPGPGPRRPGRRRAGSGRAPPRRGRGWPGRGPPPAPRGPRGMSMRTPQPSPSPSTLPARCSIFSSATRAVATASWVGRAALSTDA